MQLCNVYVIYVKGLMLLIYIGPPILVIFHVDVGVGVAIPRISRKWGSHTTYI
eukprot:COSAG05_NODE_24841_length_200_cov_126.792079_1_plen_52_part_01